MPAELDNKRTLVRVLFRADRTSRLIGDLARLRNEFVGAANHANDRLARLEQLAAAAIQLGMSHNIVGTASGIPQGRIEAVLEAHPSGVNRLASNYQRQASGVVCKRDL